MFGLSGDNLTVAVFFWSFAGLFFFEGRKERGMGKWVLWGLAGICIAAGFAWRYVEQFWPTGFDFVRTIAVTPETWFTIFVAAFLLFVIGARLKSSDLLVQISNLQTDVRELKSVKSRIAQPSKFDPAVTWKIWKIKGSYTVAELSRILVRMDPAGGKLSTEGLGIQTLIFEQMKTGKIPYRKKMTIFGLDEVEQGPSLETEIEKGDALFWARHNGFDISHVEG